MLSQLQIGKIVTEALLEDIGHGDITTEAIIPKESRAKAQIKCKEAGVLAGVPFAEATFSSLDSEARFSLAREEGEVISPQTIILCIEASTRALLTGERTALNFLQRLSGIATLTRQYCQAVEKSSIKILDTRKTTPTLRFIEKYAVRIGGGTNYRSGLYDAVMIKDNHIQAAGSIEKAVATVVHAYGDKYPIIVEAATLEQVAEALKTKATRIMLDNMSPETIAEAIEIIDKKKEIEVSGGITVEKARSLAHLKIDYLSAGALTNKAPSLDISMDIL